MKYKRVPDSINIGHYTVNVKYVNNLMLVRKASGEWHGDLKEIHIDSSLKGTEKWEVFIHELIEAVVWAYDVKVDHHSLYLIAVGLTQCLSDVITKKDKR